MSRDKTLTGAFGRVTAATGPVGEAKVRQGGGLLGANSEGACGVVGVVIVRELGTPA